MRIGIIDTGSANLNSVRQALRRSGAESFVSQDPEELSSADKLILPGVGSAAAAMEVLKDHALPEFIVHTKVPLLGICLGLQLLAGGSEEGSAGADTVPCLGVINGTVRALNPAVRLPHLGWNTVSHRGGPLFEGIRSGAFFYFDHSYALECGPYTAGSCDYGGSFTAVLVHGFFAAAQFHPEKSGAAGERFLLNFLQRFEGES